MNIRQAKDYVKQTVQLYLKKDELGEYRIPVVRQRPLFLLGVPGIGKTQIMEQVAGELGIALVSYSMTHHTRQSAIGLPVIVHKEYKGIKYDASEYTMSEIISSIYDVMTKSGITEGILFLDEINCVSETLAPAMLQFLQYKVFGAHQVPEGWVIVTAGNPPEYNKSVREFDVVTMDRMKVLQVDADYSVWRDYALEHGTHNAIISFLDLNKEYFYRVESTVGGRSYITARGWEDLSTMIKLMEEEGVNVDETLIAQYIHNEKAVREFSAYYDLYNKYRRDYQMEEILRGEVSEFAKTKAKASAFEERLSLVTMLNDEVTSHMRDCMDKSEYLTEAMPTLKNATKSDDVYAIVEILDAQIEQRTKKLDSLQSAGSLSPDDKRRNKRIILFFRKIREAVLVLKAGESAVTCIKQIFDGQVEELKTKSARTQTELENLFAFVTEAYGEGDGRELLLLLTALTANKYSSAFIARFGSESYTRYSSEMMLSERKNDLLVEIKALEL